MRRPVVAGIEEAVAEANDRFYQALSRRSLDEMDALWLPAEWAECVHPGWPILHGWTAIRESWAEIFSNTARFSVTITDTRVHVVGDMAWVTCLERISTGGPTHLDTSLAQATNIFLRRQDRWRLLVHHASPAPISAPGLWEVDPRSVH
jgi:ketosteroid isomerase-like protein